MELHQFSNQIPSYKKLSEAFKSKSDNLEEVIKIAVMEQTELDQKKRELAENWKAFDALLASPDYPATNANVKISQTKIENALKEGKYTWNEDKTQIVSGNFSKTMYNKLTFGTLIKKVNEAKAKPAAGGVKTKSEVSYTLPKERLVQFIERARSDLTKWTPKIQETEGEKIEELNKMLLEAEAAETEYNVEKIKKMGEYLEKKWKGGDAEVPKKKEEPKKQKEEKKEKKSFFESRYKKIIAKKSSLGYNDRIKLEDQLKLEKDGDKVFHLDDLISKFAKLKDATKKQEASREIEFLLDNAEKFIQKSEKRKTSAFPPDHFDNHPMDEEEEEEEDEEDDDEEDEEDEEEEESDDSESEEKERRRNTRSKRVTAEKRPRNEDLKSILGAVIDAKRDQRRKLFELCDQSEEFNNYLKSIATKKYLTVLCIDGKEMPIKFCPEPNCFNNKYEAEERARYIEKDMAGGNEHVKVIIKEQE
jgi:hypothetical protein